jgi:hypothetical protein
MVSRFASCCWYCCCRSCCLTNSRSNCRSCWWKLQGWHSQIREMRGSDTE